MGKDHSIKKPHLISAAEIVDVDGAFFVNLLPMFLLQKAFTTKLVVGHTS